MKGLIKISIIIPVYNASIFLRECIDSILSQSFRDFELLLINDGSKDDSGSICDEYANKDSRIRVFHQDNCGVSVTRNVGLDNATGEWIVFADADDIMLPDALKMFYATAIDYNPDIIAGSTKVRVNDKVSPLYVYNNKQNNDPLMAMGHPALWGYMFRASVIKDNNIHFIPGLAYSEDQVFLAETAVCSKSIVYISEFVYLYRRNEASACYNKDGVMTSRHNFWAAAAIRELALRITNRRYKEFLFKKVKRLIKAGCYDYVTNSFSLKTYLKYEGQYLEFFDNRCLLFFYTIITWFIVKRRNLISFRDNPLSGRKGFFSKIKMWFQN